MWFMLERWRVCVTWCGQMFRWRQNGKCHKVRDGLYQELKRTINLLDVTLERGMSELTMGMLWENTERESEWVINTKTVFGGDCTSRSPRRLNQTFQHPPFSGCKLVARTAYWTRGEPRKLQHGADGNETVRYGGMVLCFFFFEVIYYRCDVFSKITVYFIHSLSRTC